MTYDELTLHSALAGRLGFEFDEQTLSPSLRKKLKEASAQYEYLKISERELRSKERIVRHGLKKSLRIALGIGGLLSFIVAFYLSANLKLTIGGGGRPEELYPFVFIVIGMVLMFVSALSSTQNLEEANESLGEIETMQRERNLLLDELEKEIMAQLTDVWKAKVSPTIKRISIDFTEVVSYLRGKGLLIQSMDWPYCGGQLSLPKSGQYTTCQHCGRNVAAIDVFEKIKEIFR